MKTVHCETKDSFFNSEFCFVWAQCAVLGHWPGAGTQWAIVLILAGGCIGIVWVWVGASGHTMLSLDSSPLVIPLPAGRAPWSQRPSSSSSTFSILQVPIILNWLPNSTYICLDFPLYCKSGSWWWDTFTFLHLAYFAHSSTFSFLIWYSCPATSISDINFIRSLVAEFFGSLVAVL